VCLQVLSPFYIFQVFSVTVWFFEGYNYYATVIVLIAVLSVTINVYMTSKNQRTLHRLMHSEGTVSVLRRQDLLGNHVPVDVSSRDLVPGDIVLIPPNGTYSF